jgi:UDP-glucose 4-epimerase
VRVVVTGATGNVGTSVLDALNDEPAVDSIIGLARRVPASDPLPGGRWSKVSWAEADVVTDDLTKAFAGADAVVHLAWLIQPSHELDVLRATNVDGSRRVFEAAAEAGARHLVYASSVGTYSPGPKDEFVTESWPTSGTHTSFYARHKSEVERLLDSFQVANPDIRVVRLRPALIFKREAASRIKRLFFGARFPARLLRPSLLPLVPRARRLVFQAVHTDDVADAYRLAVVNGDAHGAFNIAADPVLDPEELGRALGARPVPVPMGALRVGADLSWRLRLQPTPAGWVDMASNVPLLDSGRARRELGWSARTSATDALRELFEGLAEHAKGPTPALSGL